MTNLKIGFMLYIENNVINIQYKMKKIYDFLNYRYYKTAIVINNDQLDYNSNKVG